LDYGKASYYRASDGGRGRYCSDGKLRFSRGAFNDCLDDDEKNDSFYSIADV
jgi:hypothetical protein